MRTIASWPYEPKYTDEDMEAVLAFLSTKNKKNFQITANFVITGRNSEGMFMSTPYVGAGCHRGISEASQFTERVLVGTETGWFRANVYNEPTKTRELVTPFARWFSTSWMSRFLIDSSVDFILDVGVVVSADIPANILQNIMITARHFNEFSHVGFKKFNELVAAGIDGDLAYVTVGLTTISAMKEEKPNHPVSAYGGHRPFMPMSFDDLFGNFIPRVVDKKFKASGNYRVETRYYGGIYLFAEGSSLVLSLFIRKDFTERLATYRKARPIAAYKPPNPFDSRAPTLSSNQVTVEEMLAVVAPYLQEHLVSLSTEEKEAA